jgi:hypothetical protein
MNALAAPHSITTASLVDQLGGAVSDGSLGRQRDHGPNMADFDIEAYLEAQIDVSSRILMQVT